MSHPMYNPYAAGNQRPTQGQYGPSSMQTERDPQLAPSHMGPGTNFSSVGVSSGTPASFVGVPSIPLLSQSMNYRPEQSWGPMDKDIERSIDMHISRVRESVGKPMSQTTGQGTSLSSSQHDELHHSGVGMSSYHMSSTSARNACVEKGSSSLDWLSNYSKRPTTDSFRSSSSYLSSSDSRFDTSSEKDRGASIPGLGDYDYPPDKPAAPPEPSRHIYTSESATNILLHFGLEKDDLEDLIAYPEDQVTPANLPLILRQIRIQKAERTATAASTAYSETSSSRSGMDSLSSSKPKGYPEPPPLPPSRSRMDSLNSSRPKGYLEPPPLPPSRSGMDSLSSSRPKTYPEPPPLAPLRSTVDSVSGSKSKLYPEHLSCRSGMDSLSSCGTAEMRPKEISSSILQPSKVIDYGHVGKYTGVVADEMGRTSGGRASGGSEGILKMDTNNGSSREPLQSNAPALKSSGLVPSRDKGSSFSGLSSMYSSILSSGTPPSHDRTKGLNNEPNQSSILSSFNLPKTDTDIRVHNPETSKPIPVKEPNMDHKHHSVRSSRPGFVVYDSRAKDQSKTQGSTVAEVAQKQEMQQQVWKQAVPQQKTQPMTSPVTMQKPVGQTLGLPGSSAAKPTVSSVPLTSHIPSITNTLRRPVVFPGASHPVVIQPTLPQSTVPFVPSTPSVLPTNKQPLANVTTSKGLPTHALMHDYAAASPRVFPHTCCLCSRQCGHMKDWITHQNTSLHLENCKKLRQQYPEWDGEIKLPSSAAKSSQPQHRPLKTRHESRSRSRSRSRSSSPRRFYDSDSRREKYRSRSRSRSPPSSRHSRRSWSRSPPTSSRHYRSRSRERRFSPKRSHERRSPRRIDERRLSPRRIREGRPSPLRSHDRKSSPPSEERRLVSRSSHEKQSSSEKSSTQRKSSSSSAEKLAKKLLESTAVQSLSNQSDLETMVKTLAPALLAELAKINSSAASSSSSSSSKGGKRSPPRSAGGKKSSFSASSSLTTAKKKEPIKGKPSAQKTETTSSAKKASLPTQVWIGGLTDRVSHEDVASAVEQFGKTKSLLLFRLKQQAMVMFEKEEDAKKLKNAKMFQIKGHSVTIIKEKGSVSKEEKKLPFTESKQQKKPLQKPVSASKPSTTTATSSTPRKAVTTSAPAGKVSVKGQGTVTGAKVVVSKVKKASAKVTVKSEVSVKTAVKKAAIKPQLNEGGNIINISNDESEAVAQKRPVKTPEDKSTAAGAAAKQKVKETAAKGSTDACSGIKTSKHEGSESPKHTAEAPEIGKKTVPKPEVKAEPDKTIDETKDPEPMEVEKMGDESMKVESHTESTEEKETIPEAVPVDSTEKSTESQVPSSSPGTPPPPTTTAHTTPKLPAEDNTQWSQTATAVPENIVEVLPQVPQSPVAPESTVLQPEDKTEASQIQQQAVEVLSEATVETNLQEDPAVSENTETNAPLSEVTSKTEIMDMDASTAEVTSTVEQTETNASTAEVTSTVEKMETNASTAEVTSTVEKMETDASTAEVTSTPEAKAAAMDKVEPSTSTAPAAAETSLTIGELLHEHLRQARFVCLKMKNIFTPKFLSNTDRRQLLISGLPPYSDGCYTEDDITKLLKPFGFQYEDDTIYVIPQTQLAVVMMPTVQCVVKAMRGLAKNGCTLNGNLIKMHVIENTMGMTPIGFYKSLMKRIKLRVSGDREKIVYIKNISPSQINDLREKLQKIDFVKHFLPLLNKVFVEFKSGRDADRLGVWHSLLNKTPPYEIYRLKQPHSFTSALPPRLTAKAIPDSVDAAPGVIIPGANFGIPQGSMCPFWVPMTTRSFLFPTESPWFIIPDFLTVRKSEDIYKVKRSLLPTIMLTGLPEANYSHVDIAKLVWPYFPKQTLQSLYYNIIVLTLQRRAFVYFSNWNKCLAFVREHIKNPIFMKGVPLYVHCVLQNMSAVYSEENMYKSLMKLSNSRAPDPESLEERLLCVELAETSDSIIEAAVGVVASIAPFLSFLPLANRICIEMKDASGVAKVMENHSAHTPSLEECTVWDKVKRFEPVQSLKQRLQDSGDTIINLDTISQLINIETVTDEATSAAEEPQTLPDPPPTPSDNRTQTDTSVSAEPAETVITEPSDPTNEAALMEDTEQSESVTSMDVSITPVNEEHVREEVSEEEAVSADDIPLMSEVLCENESASSPDSLALVVKPEDNADKFPQINEEVFKVLTAAVRQHRLIKGSSSHTGETPPLVPPSNESQPTLQSSSPASAASSPTAVKPEENVSDLSVNNEGSLQVLTAAVGQHMIIKASSSDSTEKEDQVSEEPDLSGDYVSSDYFNMEDFVTVDEVCDDGGDTIPQCHHSPQRTSKKSSETKREGNKESQGSSSSSDTKWSSARSSKDSKRSASSSSSSSSRSTKEHFKSPSSSSSTSGSPKKNKEPSASSKSPSKTSSSKASASVPSTSSDSATLSSRSHSASSAHKKEKMTTAASVEAHSVNAKAENVVAKSDHQVSAESTAAKTVESEAKTNAPSEMHPPLQEQRVQGTSQAQKGSSRVHLNEETVKDLRRNKLGNDEDALKYTEKGDDEVESYQILDSVDEQTDEQMDDEAQGGLHEGQTLNEETFQILDSVDDEGKAEECSEMEMDASFQVLDSLTEEKESTDKQPSEKESTPGNEKSTNQDAVAGDQKINPDDADIKHGERSTREGSRRKRKQDTLSESHKSTKEVENPQEEVMKATVTEPVSDITDQETFEILDSIDDQTATVSEVTDVNPVTRSKRYGSRRKRKEEALPEESHKISKEVENTDGQTRKEDGKDTFKQLYSESTEEETFEILDSIEEQTATQNDVQKPETCSDQKEHVKPKEGGEEEAYQVIDSVEGQPTIIETELETERKEKQMKKTETTRTTRRSVTSTRASRSEEAEKSSSKKHERTVKRYENPAKKETSAGVTRKDKEIQEVAEETVYEIVDSVEDEPAQDRSMRRRSTRGRKEEITEASKKADRDEDATYDILDSVEDKSASDEPSITTRSKGRPRATKRDTLSNRAKTSQKEDMPTKKMRTPARESQERKMENASKKDNKDGTPTNTDKEVIDEEMTYQILDSLEDEGVEHDPPVTEVKAKRGRPKKQVKTTKKGSKTLKNEQVAEEEEATYQILDSLEEETVDNMSSTNQTEARPIETLHHDEDELVKSLTPVTGSLKKEEEEEEEEEPVYEIVDSLEDDQGQDETAIVEEKRETKDESPSKGGAVPARGDFPTCSSTEPETVDVQEKSQTADVLEQVKDGTGVGEESRTKESSPKIDKEDIESQSDVLKLEYKTEQKNDNTAAMSTLTNRDEVREEEDDHDNTSKEGELRTTQVTAKDTRLSKDPVERRTKEREDRRTRDNEEEKRRSSRRRGTRRTKGRGRDEEETVEVDAKELVTVDEVGADEAGTEAEQESQEWEGEMQTLVTLDEIVEEEEEEAQAEQSTLKTHLPIQDEESTDSLNPETLVTLDEAGDDEEEEETKAEEEKSFTVIKDKHEETEESVNFVTVDEVGEVEDQKEEATPRRRGRGRKRCRQAPVRKSIRGKRVCEKDAREEEGKGGADTDAPPPASSHPAPSSDKAVSTSVQSDVLNADSEGRSQDSVHADSGGREQKQTLDRGVEEGTEGTEETERWSRAHIKVDSKRRREPLGPEVKRSRSQSPCVSSDFKLPPFTPNTPLGPEFVVPKSGFFCNLCCLFYLNESTAREQHCSSQRHYHNLQKHYQKLQQKQLRSSAASTEGAAVSDLD